MSDIDATLEPFEDRMYEVYLNYCEQNNTKPAISDYVQWLDEKYGYEIPSLQVPDFVYQEEIMERAERIRDGMREDGIAI